MIFCMKKGYGCKCYSSDYDIVASAMFVDESIWENVTGLAVLHYSNSKGKASGPLPDTQISIYHTFCPLNHAMSIRLNVSANGALPNPLGSFDYGDITITDTYILKNVPPMMIDGKLYEGFIEVIMISVFKAFTWMAIPFM